MFYTTNKAHNRSGLAASVAAENVQKLLDGYHLNTTTFHLRHQLKIALKVVITAHQVACVAAYSSFQKH